ncbi:NAD-dependent epimerase/dehydratase family protein [Butyrivibrio sp. VCB2006]|uniref:NAD-dependent epimerase/dehydratase family protein n=1 Tax=Butyrivibrio sp. VCB2006 TaxID=1280679 RepID=UPI0003FBF5CC|nr:NAD(P)-dependent oxidoreductase [Butyrivibrio sp. VCB2006]
MKIAIVTGAFGFAGANLVEHLLSKNIKVYAVGRKNSSHNDRFKGVPENKLVNVFLEMEEYDRLPEFVSEKADFFFHLAWGGGREDFDAQLKNVDGSLKALEAAAKINPKIHFVGIGSQAEYGIKSDCDLIAEDMTLDPLTAYGSCKTAAYYLLRNRAGALGIDFIWARIFSLIGKYEEQGRMIPDLVDKITKGQKIQLSSCEQYWDYLDAEDAAGAILSLAEKGMAGEVYNIANGNFRQLKDFVLEAVEVIGGDTNLAEFGSKAEPFISLRPSILKIQRDTGWEPHISFAETIKKYL